MDGAGNNKAPRGGVAGAAPLNYRYHHHHHKKNGESSWNGAEEAWEEGARHITTTRNPCLARPLSAHEVKGGLVKLCEWGYSRQPTNHHSILPSSFVLWQPQYTASSFNLGNRKIDILPSQGMRIQVLAGHPCYISGYGYVCVSGWMDNTWFDGPRWFKTLSFGPISCQWMEIVLFLSILFMSWISLSTNWFKEF